MATCNFWTMDNFDLYAISNEDVVNTFLNLDFEEADDYDIDIAWDCFDCEIASHIDELNEGLKWYYAELKSGYYEGMQIYIDTEWDTIGEWTEEDCEEEFGLTKKETMLMILEEQKKINKWLEEESTKLGFRKLKCVGVFSNGEAIYEYA